MVSLHRAVLIRVFAEEGLLRMVFTRSLGHMYEQWISPLLMFIFYPLFKLKKMGMYEVHLGLSCRPTDIQSYSLFFFCI